MVDVNKFGRHDHGIDDPGPGTGYRLAQRSNETQNMMCFRGRLHIVFCIVFLAGPGESFIGRTHHFRPGYRPC